MEGINNYHAKTLWNFHPITLFSWWSKVLESALLAIILANFENEDIINLFYLWYIFKYFVYLTIFIWSALFGEAVKNQSSNTYYPSHQIILLQLHFQCESTESIIHFQKYTSNCPTRFITRSLLIQSFHERHPQAIQFLHEFKNKLQTPQSMRSKNKPQNAKEVAWIY